MICSKDPLFLWLFLQSFVLFYKDSNSPVLLVSFLKVATFILLSYDSESNCFLFPLKIHTNRFKANQNRKKSIKYNLHWILFGFVSVVPVPLPTPSEHQKNKFGDIFCSDSSLSLTPVLQLPLLFCGKNYWYLLSCIECYLKMSAIWLGGFVHVCF